MRNPSKITWLGTFLIIFIFSAGVFFFQWRQVKGELVRQIGQKENLMKQIGELQKEINELKTTEEKATDETADWEIYRNEEYGFEIDYPTIGWEFKYREPFFLLSKQITEREKDIVAFYITAEIEFLSNDECSKYFLEEIIKNRELMLRCIVDASFAMDFEKEIITNFKVKGYEGKGGGYRYGIKGTGIQAVVFPILKEVYWGKTRVKWGETEFRPILVIYCDLETHYTDEDIEVFNKVVSTFRYIEK